MSVRAKMSVNDKIKQKPIKNTNSKNTNNPNPTHSDHSAPTVCLSGSIERVTFHSKESGFCVLKIKARGHKDLVTVVGQVATVTAGEYLDCEGHWVNNREYGLQLQAKQLRVVLPSTIEGIEKYLGSGLIRGIGPHFAKRLIKAFGDKIFDIIEKSPERLKEVPGFGTVRQTRMIQSWQDQKIIRDIIVFLQSHGVGTARAVRIYKTYGKNAIQIVNENPYRLALDIRGIGFKTADALAKRLGIPHDSVKRSQAGVRHVLQELCTAGHSAVMLETLIEEASRLLDMSIPLITEGIDIEIKEGNFIQDEINQKPCIFLVQYYRAEVNVAKHLHRLSAHTDSLLKDVAQNEAIEWVQKKTALTLSFNQKEAIRETLQNKIVIITGGPGVGKTTVINSILKIVQQKSHKILLAAPTGRAAKRLSESTKHEAKTIHRLLEFDPKTFQFKRSEVNTLDVDFLVIDEMSMVDILLMQSLLKAIPDHAQLLLVGDVDQLPSVGSGAVLSNLIDSQSIKTVRLTEIFRQAKTSQIIVNAHKINHGVIPKVSQNQEILSDFYFIPADSKEMIHERLLQVVEKRIPKRFGFDPIRQVQVLVPMNRGILGMRSINIELQKRLNPNYQNGIERFGFIFSVNDKIIQTVNNYNKEVYNGDIGIITSIDKEESLIWVDFDGRQVDYEFDELDEISLAYATTIHKAQGSEYEAVVIPLATEHFSLLERNLLYTGVTRGKKLVVLIGQIKALAIAVHTERSTKRITNLAHRVAMTF